MTTASEPGWKATAVCCDANRGSVEWYWRWPSARRGPAASAIPAGQGRGIPAQRLTYPQGVEVVRHQAVPQVANNKPLPIARDRERAHRFAGRRRIVRACAKNKAGGGGGRALAKIRRRGRGKTATPCWDGQSQRRSQSAKRTHLRPAPWVGGPTRAQPSRCCCCQSRGSQCRRRHVPQPACASSAQT